MPRGRKCEKKHSAAGEQRAKKKRNHILHIHITFNGCYVACTQHQVWQVFFTFFQYLASYTKCTEYHVLYRYSYYTHTVCVTFSVSSNHIMAAADEPTRARHWLLRLIVAGHGFLLLLISARCGKLLGAWQSERRPFHLLTVI